jgi:uncharacterized protein YukE
VTSKLTPAQFKVDLAQLAAATTKVAGEAEAIRSSITIINQSMFEVEVWWRSPAGAIFTGTQEACTTQMNALITLLDDAVTRMRAAYKNYHAMELLNSEILIANQQLNAEIAREKAWVAAHNATINGEIAHINAEVKANHGFGNAHIKSEVASVNAQIAAEKTYIAAEAAKIKAMAKAERDLIKSVTGK